MKKIHISGIKKNILIGFIFFFISIGILIIIILNTVYLKSFEDLEIRDVEKNINLVNREIQSNLNEITRSSLDWGVWDDTYLYSQGLDHDYEKSNLIDENFDLYDLDIIIFTDDSGNILYGKEKNLEREEIVNIDSEVYQSLSNSDFFKNNDPQVSFSDILIFEENPILIASHPIVKTDGSGPSKGKVVFARTIDDQLMNEISKKLNLVTSFELLSQGEFDQIDGINENGVEIQLKDKDFILANSYIAGSLGKYYMKISVEMPRDITKLGYNSIKYLRIIIPSVFIFILTMLWTALDKLVLSRLVKLNNQVLAIKEENSPAIGVDLDDKDDEISELSQGINEMLASLEDLQNEISQTNNMLERKVLERTQELEMEILQREKIQEKVSFLAYHDILTGLPNRQLLTSKLNDKILQARDKESLISIMFINIDEFKIINDTLGHDQGDELLKQFSTRLFKLVGENDGASRVGGDEFVLYFNGYKDQETLDITISKLMNVFKKPFYLRCQEYFITGSIGIAQYPVDGEDFETLMKNSNMAMYKAKSLGKNQYLKCSNDLKNSVLESISLTNSLYRAIEQNEMLLYYQPQVNALTGEITGVEALLRWSHPTYGFVPPFKFIPIAEKTRLIIPIGYWVLKTACEQCKSWQEKGLKPIKMAVNFSVYQLNYPGIIEQIKEVLEKTSLEAKYLEIEITETTAMDHNVQIKETLEKIKSLGISLSIDDFGKEYSSLNRLKELPIDRVKIDMSFIQGIGKSPKDETITKAVILLAANLDLTTIAEGVETKEQMDFLNKNLCNKLQGYYFHKPMPSDEIKKLL